MLVLLDTPNHKTLSFNVCNARPLEDLGAQADALFSNGVSRDSMYVTGRHGLTAIEALEESRGSMVRLCLHGRLAGGKGGFGSMLRSQGSRMKSDKPENYDDCRDLYGRRLKTLKEAKSIVDKLEAEDEAREIIKERKRKKIQDGLRGPPEKKHRFDDVEYTKSCEQIVDATKSTTRKAMKRKMQPKESSDNDENASSSSSGAPMVPLFDGDIADLSDSSNSSSSDDDDGARSDKEDSPR
ncbi:hypothetical protein LPJ59_004237 [Coemansia sp. RSA 2399]|nr:hypothetical protein LPJ59_004237 [Coemansia sp. RSA 2399]